VAAAVVVAVAALAGSRFLANPGTSPAVTAAPSRPPVVIGPLDIGTYTSREFQPPVTFAIEDQGWTANRDTAEVLGLVREVAPRGSVYFLRVEEVLQDPCAQGGQGAETSPGAAGLLADLEDLDHLTLANQQIVQIGGYEGEQVDVTVEDHALAACGGLVGAPAAVFAAGGEVWGASPGELFRLVAIDVDDAAVTFLLSTEWTETQSVQEFEALLRIGQGVLDSVRF
jgi:hypothetical protein